MNDFRQEGHQPVFVASDTRKEVFKVKSESRVKEEDKISSQGASSLLKLERETFKILHADQGREPRQDYKNYTRATTTTTNYQLAYRDCTLSQDLTSRRSNQGARRQDVLIVVKHEALSLEHANLSARSKLLLRLDKIFLEYTGLSCFIDLLACANFINSTNRIRMTTLLGRRFASKLESILELHRIDRSEWFIGRHDKRFKLHYLLPRLTFALCVVSFLHLTVYVIYAYAHDYQRFRLKRVTWINASHPELFLEQSLESRDYLERKLFVTKESLTLVGSLQSFSSATRPHICYLPQCLCLIVQGFWILAHVLPMLYYKYIQPYDFHYARNFFDRPNEEQLCERQVVQQASLFVESSRNFTCALKEFCEVSLGRRGLFTTTTTTITKSTANTKSVSERARPRRRQASCCCCCCRLGTACCAAPESLSCRQLSCLVAEGLLRPIDQSTKWIERQLYDYACLMLLTFPVSIIIYISILIIYFSLIDLGAASWRDLLLSFELLFLGALFNISGIFHVTNLMLACYDQIKLATKLRKLIRHLVNLNNLRFYGTIRRLKRGRSRFAPTDGATNYIVCNQFQKDSTTSLPQNSAAASAAAINTMTQVHNYKWQQQQQQKQQQQQQQQGDAAAAAELINQLESKMNEDLLLAIMHYRVFVARLISLIRPLGLTAIVAALVVFLLPIIGRLHLPYFSSVHERKVISGYSCLILFLGNMALYGPACMHRRCLELYVSLNSILAHATDITNQREGIKIYDKHLLSILQKELSMQQGIVSRFAIKFAGLSFNYANLVRINFYVGFLLLSIMGSETQSSEQELAPSFMSDPFGLF